MSAIRLYYFRARPNLGDALNIDVLEKIFHKKVVYSQPPECDLVAIGSLLEQFIYPFKHRDLNYLIKKYLNPELHVWGTGFIEPPETRNEHFFRKMRFSAVRGKVTLERIKKSGSAGDAGGIALGDPGLLASLLLSVRPGKKYKLGIIPHYVDRDSPVIADINNNIKGSVIMDVGHPPMDVVKAIAQCETVISSGMHGLIVADSLGVPNQRIRLSDRIIGDDYKFIDYYSAYDMGLPGFIDLRHRQFTEDDLDGIEREYKIKASDVDSIQRELIKAFPSK